MQMEVWLQRNAAACDVFIVVADETKRADSLKLVTDLRRAGISADLPLIHAKVAKQFQSAEKSGARFALVVGAEFPELKLKVLASRIEETGHAGNRHRMAHRPPPRTRRPAARLMTGVMDHAS